MEHATTTDPQGIIPEEAPMGSWNPAFRPEDNGPDNVVAKALPEPLSPQATILSESQQEGHNGDTTPSVESSSTPDAITDGIRPSRDGQLVSMPATNAQLHDHETQAVTEAPETGRTSPDPFEKLDVTRTNSFPDMDVNEGEWEALLQAGTDAADDEGSSVKDGDKIQQPAIEQAYRRLQDNDDSTALKPTPIAGDEDDGYSFFDQVNSQTKPIYNPPEAESRFEEGVPLVNNNNTEALSPVETKGRASLDELFQQGATTDDAGFFSSNLEDEASSTPQILKPPAFTRKSTSQVLGSLNLQDHPIAEDSTIEDPSPSMIVQEAEPTNAGEPSAGEDAPADDIEARWKALLGDDDLLMDDEFLPDGADTADAAPQDHAAAYFATPFSHENSQQAAPQSGHYGPQPTSFPPPAMQQNNSAFGSSRTNVYTPHQPSSSDLLAGLPTPHYAQPVQNTASANAADKPVSFVTQSKAGYQSPYDLPEDIRPKRPPVHRAPTTQHPAISSMPPPPRTSSMSGVRPASSSSAMPPPPIGPPASTVVPTPQSTERPGSGASNFFEELPTTSKSRPSTRGRYTPQPQGPPSAPNTAVPTQYSPLQRQPSSTFGPPPLQQAQKVGPYDSFPVPAQSAPVQTSRYSPKPPSLEPGARVSSPRYSPVPPPQAGPPNKYIAPPSMLPFQPRTSSPLAHHETHPLAFQPQVESADGVKSAFQAPVHPPQSQISGEPMSRVSSPESKRLGNPPVNRYMPQQHPPSTFPGPPPHAASSQHVQQPTGVAAVSAYAPPPAPSSQIMPPLKRSMTQSPTKRVSSLNQPPKTAQQSVTRPASVHGTRFSAPQLDFVTPTDGLECDPLERWKGAPIFKFGSGGTVLSSFPKHIPRYATGHIVPKLKPSPGELKTRQFGDVVTGAGPGLKFPGPLRSKSKKKDVVSWLSAMISSFEEELASDAIYTDQTSQHRLEEKILLWKLVKELVNHDGVLEGTLEIEKSVRSILSPVSQTDGPESQAGLGVHSGTLGAGTAQFEPTSSVGLDRLRTNLLAGDREKAVWEAVDNRLWGHAMLLSSTLDKSVWKQVAQEFIRREVRSVGDDNEPLAALYEIFAGNAEESVDELVPVSARAGLQFVSTNTGTGSSKNALDGLNKWRETVSLVLSNRSPQDHQALLALSRLLGSYGRVEASHICALFAKSASIPVIGGLREPQSAIVLLGADHQNFPSTFMNDRNSWLLTEVYEYAVSVLAGSPLHVLPHLQAFKLQYARVLAEEGHKSEAQEYCDSIGAILRSTSKPSPYYHQTFCAELDELSNRLRQSAGDGASSWISRPSMEKVSGSVWAKFNQFVTGDDSDAGSTGSGKGADADVGPFSKMVGTPPISRSPSVTDSYFVPAHQNSSTMSSSSTARYAPGNQNASPDQNRGRRSLDSQRSPSYGSLGYSQRRQSQDPGISHDGANHHTPPNPTYGSPVSYAPIQNYSPLAPVEEGYSPALSVSGGASTSSGVANPYQPTQAPEPQMMPQPSYGQEGGYAPPTQGGYEPPTGTTGYQPSSYEPPSYEPAAPETDGAEQEITEKKPFMGDDDDDMMARAEQVKQAERERRNQEAAEAVRKAAEEDGT